MKFELNQLIKKSNLQLTDQQIDLLIDYITMLFKWNKAYNLTAVRNPHEMLVKHIMDSIIIAPYLNGTNFIDVGTGAGLPGVPLAIVKPDCQFDLVDSLGKRIRFLKQVKFELGLGNIHPTQSRIEDYQYKTFDGVISRAFASLNDMLTWCYHLPNKTGRFYALKGTIDDHELSNIPVNFVIEQVIKLNVPHLEGERHLVIVQKR